MRSASRRPSNTWCRERIKIVNHSVAWFDTSRGDGTGSRDADAIVADARANGVLWVNAAGNYGLDHWAGYYTPDSVETQP